MKELFEKKGRLHNQMQALLDAAKSESRSLTAEESARFDAMDADYEAVCKDIDRAQKMEARSAELAASQGRRTSSTMTGTAQEDELRSWLMTSQRSAAMQEAAWKAGYGNKNAFVLNIRSTQVVGNNTLGGYTTQDNMLVGLEEARKAFGGARQFAQVIRTDNGNPLPWATSNETTAKGALVAESGSVANATLTFSRATLGAYKFTSNAVAVSIELLQDSAFDIGGYIGRKLGERIGRAENEYFTTGTGSDQPQGLVTGATDSGMSANAISYNVFVDVEHALEPAYRLGAKWTMSDGLLKAAKKLVDGEGRPLWVPGLTANAPDTILGYPYVINSDIAAPASNTASLVFGQPQNFIIRDVKDIVILRLDEIAALQGEVVFVAFSRSDSMVLDAGTHPLVKWVQE